MLPKTLDKLYAERINSLLNNQDLSSSELLDLGHLGKVKPNCHGTTIYIYQKQELITGPKKLFFHEGYIFPEIGPGSINKSPMTRFIKKYCKKTKNPITGDMVTLWQEKYVQKLDHKKKVLEHTGIYLNKESLFHQPDTGREFETTSIEDHINQEFSSHEKIIIEFYKLLHKYL